MDYFHPRSIKFPLIFVLVALFYFQPSKGLAFVPLKNLVLGDFSGSYEKEIQDPLDDIFRQSQIPQASDDAGPSAKRISQSRLNEYRGFYEQAANLRNSCQSSTSIEYANPWDRDQVKRSALATLQYLGLDLSTRALASYAKEFEFNEAEYRNLIDYLVGGYCSANLSIISKDELKNNMFLRFQKGEHFQLPSVKNNPLFPSFLEELVTREEVLKREFQLTRTLFKSLCSWGGDTENLRLLVPLVRNPQVMSFVFRQMTSKKLEWSESEDELQKVNADESVQVYCNGLICRRQEKNEFFQTIARSIGSIDLENDLNRLYCSDFRNIDFQRQNQVPKINEFLDKWTFDEQNFMVSHFLALLTGVPNFTIRAETFDEGQDIAKSNIDSAWDRWAKSQAGTLHGDIYFEESLSVELVDRDLYFDQEKRNFRVEFDVNLGEFDRINQKVGKLSSVFTLEVSKSLIRWVRRELYQRSPDRPEIEKRVKERMHVVLSPQIEKLREKFAIAPWKGDLTEIVTLELLEQFDTYEGRIFPPDEKGIVEIPLALHYAPFALKYVRQRALIEARQQEQRDVIRTIKKSKENENLSL